jgi:hypothetical protein
MIGIEYRLLESNCATSGLPTVTGGATGQK